MNGASFTITKYTDDTFKNKDEAWGEKGSKILTDEKKSDGTYTLNGVFAFEDLSIGYYKIEETQFPAGYVKMSEDPAFKVELDDNKYKITMIGNSDNICLIDNDLTIIIGNTPGVALPSTGGPGTRLYYLLGIMLTAFAGAGLVMRKRRRAAS